MQSQAEFYKRLTVSDKPNEKLGGNGFGLVNFMMEAWREQGFLLVLVLGVQGSGKTYYSLQVAREFLERLGYIPSDIPLVDRLKKVFRDYTSFIATEEEKLLVSAFLEKTGKKRMAQIIRRHPSMTERLDSVNWRRPYPVIVFDEAGNTAGAYDFFFNKRYVSRLDKIIQTARRRARVLIMNTTVETKLMAVIRNNPDRIQVFMHKKRGWISEARGYKYVKLPSGREMVVKLFVDYFNRRMPDDFHSYYMDISDTFTDYAMLRDRVLSDKDLALEAGLSRKRLKWDKTMQRIYNTIASLGGKARFGEIKAATGMNHATLMNRLKRLVEAGIIVKEGHGIYCLPGYDGD